MCFDRNGTTVFARLRNGNSLDQPFLAAWSVGTDASSDVPLRIESLSWERLKGVRFGGSNDLKSSMFSRDSPAPA